MLDKPPERLIIDSPNKIRVSRPMRSTKCSVCAGNGFRFSPEKYRKQNIKNNPYISNKVTQGRVKNNG